MKRTEKSQKRTKFLLLLLVLTAILSITATYAWFSTQRDVDITGMKLNVEVAESMQISLDGEKWTQSIQIANMRQFYGTYTGTGDSFAIFQAKNGDNLNYVPTELLPVSTAGEVADGKLQFVTGTIATNADGTTKLTGITTCSETDITSTATIGTKQGNNENHPYLVFDMYLRNVSAKTTGVDDLELNAGSMVWINNQETSQEGTGVTSTGLEYSARVGMIVYGNTVSITATDDEDDGAEGTTEYTIGQKIRNLTANGLEAAENPDQLAIWEPNHLDHTQYVVTNNGRGITALSQAVDTYGIKVAAASATPNEIADVNATSGDNLVAVKTFKPTYTTVAWDDADSIWTGGVTTKTVITDTSDANVGLKPNQISKVRVYVWLEGQDPDCVDLASTGDKLNVTLKLTKEPTTGGEANTYE